jgi:AcrR family transcriptional regulator
MPASEGSAESGAPGRAALLDAAVRVVARDGLDGVSYRSVAEEAGTTAGLVFYHFGSREALILEAAANAGRRSATHALLHSEEEDGLEGFLALLSTSASEDLDDHLFEYEMAFNSRRRPELGAEMRQLYRFYVEETERALAAAGLENPRPALARLIFGIIDGIVLQQVVFDDPDATDRAVSALRRLIARLIESDQS